MKSIRLSLMIYFLILLALALGAVSIIVNQTSSTALHAREQRTRDLLKDRFEARCRAGRAKTDFAILRQAKRLARLPQSPWNRNYYHELFTMNLLTAGVTPQGHLPTTFWLAEVTRPRLVWRLPRSHSVQFQPDPVYALGQLGAASHHAGLLLAPVWFSRPVSFRVHFAEGVLPGPKGGESKEFCQIVSALGQVVQRSPSMGNASLPFDPGAGKSLPLSQPTFDDVELRPGIQVRRVTLKATLPRFLTFYFRPLYSPWRGPPGERPRPSAPWPVADRTPPIFFVQWARDTAAQDALLAQYRQEYEGDLASLETDTRETLASLRQHLFWISLLTFAAILGGGFWLVRRGLTPLERLSEAVSRVSEKDFRLHFDEAGVPRELQPIVERLNQTLALLQRAFAREKQAAADISHDLRTPLAALMTTTEVALRKMRSPDEYRELLQDCRESGKQMSHLVERLLTLARLDAGRDTLRSQDVDVTVLAEQCAAVVRPLAEVRGLTLRVHSQGPVYILADPDKLREVITNLLANAIQYNRPQGTIDLTVEEEHGGLRIEVSDTGIGIPEAAREQIFERFYRGDPSRSSDGLHAGLGLAIVKGYVELMGGTIAVESIEGKGSTFRVQLPGASLGSSRFKEDASLARVRLI